MPELVTPQAQYKNSFLEALVEYKAEDLPNYRSLDPAALAADFESFLEQMKKESTGEDLPDGFVPHTVYWLVEGDTYLGRVDIRHILNDFLHKEGGHIGYDVRPSERKKGYGHLALKLGKEKAKELGMNEVLITCDITNIGSNKIIRASGGKLENTVEVGADKPAKNRYWIDLKASQEVS